MTEQDELPATGTPKKGQCKKEDDTVTHYKDGKNVFYVGETVYIESQRPDLPYYICSIKEFKRSKKDNVTVDVIWFYRPCEIPATVYQLLLQDRNAEKGSTENILDNPIVKERELFISDAVDIFPASSLRGHANCSPFIDIKENVMDYISTEDNWYYILRYNPESRRMANAKGEIRIGASHQATLPTCIEYKHRSKEDLRNLHDVCLEDLVWDPSAIQRSKMLVYFRAAFSITSFSGYCGENSPCVIDKGLNTTSKDIPMAYSHDILHRNNYDITSALQDLIAHPAPKVSMQAFSEDERKKFMRGLRSYGKTFHKIRKELLPERGTSELVQYYYFWKKTSVACNSRPHKRGGRRHNVLARKTRTTKPKVTEISEFLDLSSCSENEVVDNEDSENARDLSLYACRHCYTTKSPNWHHGGKRKVLLCYNCRIHFKRYSNMRPLKDEEKREAPSYIYKAAFENLEEQQPHIARMRTRRSSTPVFAGGVSAVRNRVLQQQDVKSNRRQVTSIESSNIEENGAKETNTSKRKITRNEATDENKETKKARVDCAESEADDADDESEVDSESSSRPDSNNQASSEGSRSQSPATNTKTIDNIQLPQQEQQKQQQQQLLEQQFPTSQHEQHEQQHEQHEQQQQQQSVIYNNPMEARMNNEAHRFMPIKEEVIEHDESDVPDDLEKLEKIKQRFKHIATDPHNSCSRCERIFVFVRPKKPKQSEAEKQRVDNHAQNRLEKDAHYKPRNSISPTVHQPAQITSHFQTMHLMKQQEIQQRYFPPYFPHEHPHGPTSPREIRDPRDPQREFYEQTAAGKYYMRVDRGPPEHRSPHLISHPAHPFTPRQNEVPGRDFRIPANSRGHLPPHVPSSMESPLSRVHHGGVSSLPGERVPPIDRPLIDSPIPVSSAVQPHLHSHLHTHTHLHVLPDELKYRSAIAANEASHFERHDRASMPHPPVVPSSVVPHQHRPTSRSMQIFEHPIKGYPTELTPQQAHDLQRRESLSRHLAREGREGHVVPPSSVGREGTVSPSFPHEPQDLHRDAVAFYHWARLHNNKLNPTGRHGPSQAPDLSPRGLPSGMRHTPSEFREKHLAERLVSSPHIQERDKIALEHVEKQIRNQNILREQETLKLKNERLLAERTFRPEDVHPSYHGNPYIDARRLQQQEPRAVYDRKMHESLHDREHLERIAGRAALQERHIRAQERAPHHERIPHDRLSDRSLRERPLHERISHDRILHERPSHDRMLHERLPLERPLYERPHERPIHERPHHDRSPLERPSIYNLKPETIDLSGE